MGIYEDIINECERKEHFLSDIQKNILSYYIEFYKNMAGDFLN